MKIEKLYFRYRKRLSLLLLIPLLYNPILEPILYSYQKNLVNKEIETVEEYILQTRPGIGGQDLRRLASTIATEAKMLELPKNAKIDGQAVDSVSLLTAIIHTESEFKRSAYSYKGARGYMQLMPPTAEWLGEITGQEVDKDSLWDASTNIHLGVTYLNILFKDTGKLETALMAYNAGPNAVHRWGGVPAYYKSIFKHYEEFQNLKNTKGDTTLPTLTALAE